MPLILVAGVLVLEVLLICLDLTRRINLMRPWWMAVYLPVALNLPLLGWFILQGGLFPVWTAPNWARVTLLVLVCLFSFYLWLRVNVFPVMDGRRMGFRLKAMIGGGPILYCNMYAFTAELILLPIFYPALAAQGVSGWLLLANGLYALGCCAVLFFNGICRVFFTSKRLSILWRVVLLLTLWIPLVNWVMWFYAARLIREEYDFAWEKQQLEQTRREGELCRTRYPLIMVHGVAFRDTRFFNYWGRIPRALIRNGATVCYGNQEALGTIEYNGGDIRRCIERVLAETGCEKVNIIAHSKGGLDARYAITALGMAERVASLTTISTPHRGCKFADRVTRLPEPVYRFIAKCFDGTFRKYGDRNPDFYTATRQFCTAPSEEFNRRVPDAPGVYYQSFASVMRGWYSDLLLSIPHLIIRFCDTPQNDGLVTPESARWGNFRGVFSNRYRRGISHGDMIDLKREDYRGFDVVETYVQIVAELKRMGF